MLPSSRPLYTEPCPGGIARLLNAPQRELECFRLFTKARGATVCRYWLYYLTEGPYPRR